MLLYYEMMFEFITSNTFMIAGLLGLLLDIIGAFSLAAVETNKFEKSLYSVRRRAAEKVQPGQSKNIHKMSRGEDITENNKEFKQIYEFIEEGCEIPNSINLNNIKNIKIVSEGERIGRDPHRDEVTAVTDSDYEVTLCSLEDLYTQSNVKRSLFMDRVEDWIKTWAPSTILVIGFSLQAVSYIGRNFFV